MGVAILGAGYVSNGASGSTAALLKGGVGVAFYSQPGTVKNFGTIVGTYFAYTDGISMAYGSGGTVINAGTIEGTKYSIEFHTSGVPGRFGADGHNKVILYSGSYLNNKMFAAGTGNVLEFAADSHQGTISHFNTGYLGFQTITVDSGSQWKLTGNGSLASAYTLTNSGTLTLAGTLTDRGAFTNNGSLIGSGNFIVDPTTFTNSGYVGLTTSLVGAGDVLSNASTGTIKVAGTAVYGTAAVSVSNAGTIVATGAGGTGVNLASSGGYVTNTGTIIGQASGVGELGGNVLNYGVIIGTLFYGVQVSGAGRVTNHGTVASYGANRPAVSFVYTLVNDGLLTGGSAGIGALQKGGATGTVLNSGTIIGYHYGINTFTEFLFVNNTKTITGTAGGGINLRAGGNITNGASGASGGLISGLSTGIGVYAGSATVTNYGTISGAYGFFIDANAGTASQTVIDSGTIAGTGGTAIAFGAGNDLLKLIPSASIKIQGKVDGGGGTNTLEFASAASHGTLSGVGASFINFTQGTIDSGAYWVFAGTNTIGSGTTLTSIGVLLDEGSLTNQGLIGNIGNGEVPVTLASGAYLLNAAGGSIVNGTGTSGSAAPVLGLGAKLSSTSAPS